LRKFTDSHPTTSLFSHNHGEEQRRPTQRMDSRTHLGNGSLLLKRSKLREILETMVSSKKSTALLPTINPFFHNHGEELRNHIQLMVSRTHLGNGSTPSHSLKKIRVTSETRRSERRFTDLLLMTTACTQPHTQEKNTLSTVS